MSRRKSKRVPKSQPEQTYERWFTYTPQPAVRFDLPIDLSRFPKGTKLIVRNYTTYGACEEPIAKD